MKQYTKNCKHCGMEFTGVKSRKFCSMACANKGKEHKGYAFGSGADNPRWSGGHVNRRNGKHYTWANAVIAKSGKCEKCGASEVELHAHHIKSYKHNIELRYQPSNGIALCAPCHWNSHSAINANAVNSVELLPSHVGDNTEPSKSRKAFEGVTTNGRACRRVLLKCYVCGHPVSRPLGEYNRNITGLVFCGKVCMGKHNIKYTRHGGNSDKSPAAERHDIV